jgi:hypothetical protein
MCLRAVYGHVTTVEFMSFTPANYQQSGTLDRADAALARARESERAAAIRKLQLQMNAVDDTERRLGVDERWTAERAEYQHALQYLDNRKFIRVVEALEGLVVQRLFELSKANLIGTGERSNILYGSIHHSSEQVINCENISPRRLLADRSLSEQLLKSTINLLHTKPLRGRFWTMPRLLRMGGSTILSF